MAINCVFIEVCSTFGNKRQDPFGMHSIHHHQLFARNRSIASSSQIIIILPSSSSCMHSTALEERCASSHHHYSNILYIHTSIQSSTSVHTQNLPGKLTEQVRLPTRKNSVCASRKKRAAWPSHLLDRLTGVMCAAHLLWSD